MRVLFIGDIVASPGRKKVKEVLPGFIKDHSIDVVVGCADNLSHGRGAKATQIAEMMEAGINFFTGGDHIFHNREFEQEIEDLPVIRAGNYPGEAPGKGYELFDLGDKGYLLLINLLGRTSFNKSASYLEDPFTTTDRILDEFKDKQNVFKLVDFHAEATSEKNALAFYLDGRVDAVVGTHTHVPTCDNRTLPGGTMFVTDVGMTGNIDSILGVKVDIIVNSFLTARPQKFDWEKTGATAFRSVILDSVTKTITRLDD
ncbi:MAG TPA: YmdB family metallophosphoesterase [candidate division WWE3 bacterium]|uniref:YmdB family metallophosphoesterase n=1 Tax=candidate division WWE3 bacterium TaxID=2053526 RepID=A0A7C1DJ41_UNCKA|nr:YmdB family metallophosphoesterase [candidate division WWE3 bacterium]